MLLFVNNIIPVARPGMTIEKSAENSDRSWLRIISADEKVNNVRKNLPTLIFLYSS